MGVYQIDIISIRWLICLFDVSFCYLSNIHLMSDVSPVHRHLGTRGPLHPLGSSSTAPRAPFTGQYYDHDKYHYNGDGSLRNGRLRQNHCHRSTSLQHSPARVTLRDAQQPPSAAQERYQPFPPATTQRIAAEGAPGSFVFEVPQGDGVFCRSSSSVLMLPTYMKSSHYATSSSLDEKAGVKEGGSSNVDASHHHLSSAGTGSSSSGGGGGGSSGGAAMAGSMEESGRMRWASASSSAKGSNSHRQHLTDDRIQGLPINVDEEWAVPCDDDDHDPLGSGAPPPQPLPSEPGLGSEFDRQVGDTSSHPQLLPVQSSSQDLRCSVFGLPCHPTSGFADELPANETAELSQRLKHSHSLLQSLYVSSDPTVQHRQAQAAAARSIMHTRGSLAPSSGVRQGGRSTEV